MVIRELSETKRRLGQHQDGMRRMLEVIVRQQSQSFPRRPATSPEG
jgi:hypothetical protein